MRHVFAIILHRVQEQARKTSHTHEKINTKTAMIYIKKYQNNNIKTNSVYPHWSNTLFR